MYAPRPCLPSPYSAYSCSSDEETSFTLAALTISVVPVTPPPGWTVCQHPEGAPYFFHEAKRVFTDANLFDAATLKFINESVNNIHDFLRVHSVQLAADGDLVLDEYVFSDGSRGAQYYFVNHHDRCVFWMDNVDSDIFAVTRQLRGMTAASHIRHELEAQYWYHCELYPRSFEVTREIIDELRDIVFHALGDVITSSSSTVSWKRDDLDDVIKLVDGFSEIVGKTAAATGWLVVRTRVYNYHSTPGARLDVDHSVYGTVRKRTLLIQTLSPLLFYAPDFHLAGLQAMFTDRLIRKRGWSQFIARLNNEWQEFTLYGTVVLNANVAFLSIQSVDQGGLPTNNRSPAQISSYLSILTSIGSIIIGLLLAKQNRDRDRETVPGAQAKFIFKRNHPKRGLETLAIMYALPYAMLIWSMVSFLAAFLFMCFQDTTLTTRSLVGVLWAAVAALILWCVFMAWESSDWDWARALLCWPLSMNWRLRPASALFSNGDAEGAQDEAGSAVSQHGSTPARPRRRLRWAWPSVFIPLRTGPYDSDGAQDEAGSAVSQHGSTPARPRRRLRWAWPSVFIPLRTWPYDSETTVTNV
ncbi:hypothetical protein C8R46DRAFT_1060923 [Mycena filopes]|nr:hypothetical protein C8R46DRAFT_1060923 [Mycena filopes]